MYPDLVAAQLQLSYDSEVALFNRAGWEVGQFPNGLADLDNLAGSINPNFIHHRLRNERCRSPRSRDLPSGGWIQANGRTNQGRATGRK